MKHLFRSRLFLLGLAIRLVLMPIFASHFLRDLFIPFVDFGITHLDVNPWTEFPPNAFPYGAALFILLFIPKFIGLLLFGKHALGTTALSFFLVKISLLALDIGLLLVLRKFAKERKQYVLIYYWLNPISIYISYIHGQLDLAAMAFCVFSIYLIVTRRTFLSAIAMASAVLCKFHVVLIIPFLVSYLWSTRFARSAINSIGIWLCVTLIFSSIGFWPVLQADQFNYVSTSSPEALRLFAFFFDFGNSHKFYIGISLVLGVLGRLCISTKITDMGLLYGSGCLFGALLLVTDTMPGWYFWVIPFMALLYSQFLNAPRLLYWAFNGVYLIYFPLLGGGHLGRSPLVSGIAFTLLQTLLGAILVTLWVLVTRREAILKRLARPIMIGLAGDSGSGKNRLSYLLTDVFGAKNAVLMEGDDYHKWERFNVKWNDYTHLNPKANHLMRMAFHANQLSLGRPILQEHYDHSVGRFTSPREIKPSKTLIVQGLHTLYLRSMREDLDLKVFLCPHPLVRLGWKLDRDVKERGHPIEDVLKNFEAREVDFLTHIEPQKKFADLIIEYYPVEDSYRQEIISGKRLKLGIQFTCWNDAPIQGVVDSLASIPNMKISLDVKADNFDRIVLNVEGDPSEHSISAIAESLFQNLRHFTRGHTPPVWKSGLEGVIQLLIVVLMGEKMGNRLS